MSMFKEQRLPLSFHMTFQPERHYLSALLVEAQTAGGGTVDEISTRTEIPTGKSTGKVRPLLQYAQGMGLLEVETMRGSGRLRLALTPLANVVLSEDKPLAEENTQWALHLMLCRRNGGAEAWYAVFVEAAAVFGRDFSDQQFEDFLRNRYGSSRDTVGPLLRCYADSGEFSRVAAVVQEKGGVRLRKVPSQPALYDTVAALLFLAWDASMPSHMQVALKDLEAASGLITATGWGREEQSHFLAVLESAGWVRVDRQTGDPILTRLATTDQVLRVMYDRVV